MLSVRSENNTSAKADPATAASTSGEAGHASAPPCAPVEAGVVAEIPAWNVLARDKDIVH